MTSFTDFYDPDLYERKIGLSPRFDDFYRTAVGDPGGPVLEMGCGTGDILLALAHQGLSVIGVDSSPAMLARCGERLAAAGVQDRSTLILATLPKLPQPVEAAAVLMTNDFVSQITDDATLGALLGLARASLPDSGRLLLDVSRFDVSRLGRLAGPDGTLTSSDGMYDYDADTLIRVAEQSRYEPGSGVLDCCVRYELIERSGEVTRTWYRRLLMHPRRASEIRMLLELAGFEVVTMTSEGLPEGVDGVFFDARVRKEGA